MYTYIIIFFYCSMFKTVENIIKIENAFYKIVWPSVLIKEKSSKFTDPYVTLTYDVSRLMVFISKLEYYIILSSKQGQWNEIVNEKSL